MDTKYIGRRIKAARERKGLTQEQLAEMVDLSPMHISVLERGAKPPKLETLISKLPGEDQRRVMEALRGYVEATDD